jgi:hypothetical protein
VEFVLVLLLVVGAALLMAAPLRRVVAEDAEAAEVAALEAAKAAKLGEIHDAELDFRGGKLSADDYRVLDRQLRAEAIDLLRRLDAARAAERQVLPQLEETS